LANERLAISSGGSSFLEARRSAEGASTGSAVLALIVLVQNKVQLLLGIAHAIGAVGARGSVVGDAGARIATQTADNTEEITIIGVLDGIANNAAKSADHAAAELLVGSGRERSSLSSPGSVNSRAVLRSCVGWSVLCRVDTSGRNLGNLGREETKVWELADRVAGDGDETCSN
jgi:hypothetical protein